jgi:hypothetical protein
VKGNRGQSRSIAFNRCQSLSIAWERCREDGRGVKSDEVGGGRKEVEKGG